VNVALTVTSHAGIINLLSVTVILLPSLVVTVQLFNLYLLSGVAVKLISVHDDAVSAEIEIVQFSTVPVVIVYVLGA